MERHGLWPQLNIAPMEKVIGPQGNIPLWFIPLWFYGRLFFDVVIVMAKEKKIQCIKYNFNQNELYALREVDKSNFTSIF